ncbi:hypothetical protein [Kutzneria albida]|uniref:Uncharacterized protein n=1 Tax=Kutzneria albida DSM 43870 TaxID=1449976 RepID=W5WJL1_9PSEU|nr:hypothetical protein [Kutzneria albida]AHH98354.1 hypothetical protein KALB_4992 [Kutzneria albida DSM 43870]
MRSLDDLPPGTPGTTGYLCPVDGCDWFHYEPPTPQPQSTGEVVTFLNEHSDPTAGSLTEAISSAVGNVLLDETRRVDAILREHFGTHQPEDFLRTINRLQGQIDCVVTEYGQLMSGGGVHVRPSSPELEAIYPLERWIPDNRRHGGTVLRRRVVVVEDWEDGPRCLLGALTGCSPEFEFLNRCFLADLHLIYDPSLRAPTADEERRWSVTRDINYAKRRTRNEHAIRTADDGHVSCVLCQNDSWPCDPIKELLQPYADRPGYEERWAL